MSLALLPQLTAAAASTSAASAASTEVNFNYGWRFFYEGVDAQGPDPHSCSQSTWTPLEPNATCSGMERNPNRFNYTDCATACCYNPDCLSWQMAVGAQGHDRECLHGYAGASVSCAVDDEGPSFMIGGKREAAPSPLLKTDYAQAKAGFDDAAWALVDAPHDFVALQDFSADADSHRGYVPRGVGWYRKRFSLPWAKGGDTLSLHFEGVFHHAEVYLNGELLQVHTAGYTGFTVRLDNSTALKWSGAANVLAVRADASYGSGHWYEGGGLYRSVHLVKSPARAFVHNGVFVVPQVNISAGAGGPTVSGQIAVSAEVEDLSGRFGAAAASDTVLFQLYEGGSDILAGSCKAALGAWQGERKLRSGSSSTQVATCGIQPTRPLGLWSIQSPTLHTVVATIASSGHSQNVTTGFRDAKWSIDEFRLNDVPMKQRGFSHHHSFGGIGSAMEGVERLHLFKVQAARALGSNIWRMR